MKKKLVLVLATLMCISLCACGGTESTSGNNNSETKTEENGFTPNQPTEETETKEEETNISDMTVEEMQKYYDTEKFIGKTTFSLFYAHYIKMHLGIYRKNLTIYPKISNFQGIGRQFSSPIPKITFLQVNYVKNNIEIGYRRKIFLYMPKV